MQRRDSILKMAAIMVGLVLAFVLNTDNTFLHLDLKGTRILPLGL